MQTTFPNDIIFSNLYLDFTLIKHQIFSGCKGTDFNIIGWFYCIYIAQQYDKNKVSFSEQGRFKSPPHSFIGHKQKDEMADASGRNELPQKGGWDCP